NEIEIADDTTIIFQQPHHWLVIIANKITVGSNVTFTWEQVAKETPPQPTKLAALSPPPTSTTMGGTDGQNGADGGPGGPGPSGDDGPEVEIWTLKINRLPAMLLSGQNGFRGGTGQDGQDGQGGAKGRSWVAGTIPGTCKSGPGNGGDGGAGGK